MRAAASLAVLASSAWLPAMTAAATATFDFDACCSSAQEATIFALAYGVPLVAFENFTISLLAAAGGPNIFNHQRALASANTRTVVRTNADTLYSYAFVDLSAADVVVRVPEIRDRYWSFAFLDPYGNNFGVLSSISGAAPGDYLVRRADDVPTAPGVEITPPSPAGIPKYKGIVNFPTTHGSLLTRIRVLQNTTAGLDTIHAYQNVASISTTPRELSQPFIPQAPALIPDLINTTDIADPNLKALTLLARMAAFNQPEVLADRYRVGAILAQAGLGAGAGGYRAPADVDLAAALAVVDNVTAAEFAAPGNLQPAGNGWVIQTAPAQGNFNTSYGLRYYIGVIGYAQLVATEVLYPVFTTTRGSGSSLGPEEAYLFTFTGRPPVVAEHGGFWSLTVYGGDQFFIPNALGRYSIGDRFPITYPDGELVYPATASNTTVPLDKVPPVAEDDMRPFQILLQPADVAPPDNWTSNWLPGPPGGGPLIFQLRWFGPSAAFTDGSYTYPTVEKVAAIV